MASDAAIKLREKWMGKSVDLFETLTFDELDVGQKFIFLPEPEEGVVDTRLRCAHYIYRKIEPVMGHEKETQGNLTGSYGKAKRIKSRKIIDVLASRSVILVK
ncbi:MAG: hypothetical protein WCW31_04050 [Patescibacteria group bacterium]|jgi:hypothetical protein